jgi:hypothetical protein
MATMIRGAIQKDRYISDLQQGEDLGAVEFVLEPELVSGYLEGIGESERELFRDKGLVPPTLMHVAKVRLLSTRFPKGPGPAARMHYRFNTRFHSTAHVGERVAVSGSCTRRYEKRGRPYIDLELTVRGEDGRLVWTSTDTSLLRLAVDG